MRHGFALVYLLVLITVSVSGCTTDKIDIDFNASELGDNLIVCEKPYMRFETGCCLDQNDNAICDSDEAGAGGAGADEPGTEAPETVSPGGTEIPPETNETAGTGPEANATITCTPPEIAHGGECCIDENYNGLCDSSEGIVTRPNLSITLTLPIAVCGDGSCFIGENSSTCPDDCGCPPGYVLYSGSCMQFTYISKTDFSIMEICGNGNCREDFENQSTCCKDCGCPSGQICSSGVCSNITMMPYTPSLSIMPAYDTYIAVTIDSVIVHDDTDPAGPGELMLFTYAGSGDTVQKLNWPYRIWYTTGSGTVAKRIPVFAMKEAEMGDNLAISVTAIDNDQMPGWLETVLDILMAPVYLILTVTETVGGSIADMELQLGGDAAAGLSEAMHGNEKIGAVNKVYLRSDDWGVSGTQYSARGGDLTVFYSIHRVSVPRSSKLGVKVYNVSIDDTGDYYDGEVFMYVRGATSFGDRDLSGVVYRFPERGTWSLGNNAFIHSGACTPDGSGGCPENPLFHLEENGPFIFIELDAWDEDNPGAGDDHDGLGTLSYTYLYSDFDMTPQTIDVTYADRVDHPWLFSGKTVRVPITTRGNMAVELELYRTTG